VGYQFVPYDEGHRNRAVERSVVGGNLGDLGDGMVDCPWVGTTPAGGASGASAEVEAGAACEGWASSQARPSSSWASGRRLAGQSLGRKC